MTSPASSLLDLKDINDLAGFLGVKKGQLDHHSYGWGHTYRAFSVKKRRGGQREIREPVSGLKFIQRTLSQGLQQIYNPRGCVQGFHPGTSIARNAQPHQKKRWVFNLDLKDFFPSINFGRVRGLLVAKPYSLPSAVATVIAQLCCYEDELPQGAPTSPVVANMICAKLDSEAGRLARQYQSVYTRYADDLTFSTNRETFPLALGRLDAEAHPPRAVVGAVLEEVIRSNGFEVNTRKVRLRGRDERQEVTGLTVNEFPNVRRSFIRRVRAMLHAWDEYGLEAAQEHFDDYYDEKDRGPYAEADFAKVVKGKIDFIGMIRGNDDRIYERLMSEYARLHPHYDLARPISDRRENHLRSFRDAVWLLESDELCSQGTAFDMAGFGLVTCAHVCKLNVDGKVVEAGDLSVHRPKRPEQRFRVRIVSLDDDRDLAVLEFSHRAPEGREMLTPRYGRATIGTPVHVAGYPGYSLGNSIWEEAGSVTGYRHHMAHPRYSVNIGIAGGASGAPVLDASGSVIAVASTGAETLEEAAAKPGTVHFGAIPIELLRAVGSPAD